MRHRLQPIVSERRRRFRLTLPTILLPFFVLVLLGRGERIRSPLDEREADLALAAQPANWSASATRARPASSWTPTATALASIAPLTLGSAERHLRLPGVFAGAAAAALAVVLGERLYATRVGLFASLLLILLPAAPVLLGDRYGVEPWYLVSMLAGLVAIRDFDESRRAALVAGVACGVAIALVGRDAAWLPALALAWLWLRRSLDARSALGVLVPCAATAAGLSLATELALDPSGGLDGLPARLWARHLLARPDAPEGLLRCLVPLGPLVILGLARLPSNWRSDDSFRFLLAWLLLALVDLHRGGSAITPWVGLLFLAATLAAWGIARARWPSALAATALAAALAAMLLPSPWMSRFRTPLDEWAARETARFVRRTIPPETPVGTEAPGIGRRLAYYAKRMILPPEEIDRAEIAILGQERFRALAARVASRDEPAATDPHPRMIAQFGPWVVARTRGSRAGAKGGLPGLAAEPGPPPGDGRKPQ